MSVIELMNHTVFNDAKTEKYSKFISEIVKAFFGKNASLSDSTSYNNYYNRLVSNPDQNFYISIREKLFVNKENRFDLIEAMQEM